jgi:hypothetical protein
MQPLESVGHAQKRYEKKALGSQQELKEENDKQPT